MKRAKKSESNNPVSTSDYELPLISDEFIQENEKHYQKTDKPRGGPYTKKNRLHRRKEVYRLHFELGYSAIKIADFMNINRNTISSDIRFWYSELYKNWNTDVIKFWLIKQVDRLETQRTRQIGDLAKCNDPKIKLSYERMIFDIDSRLAQICQNVYTRDEGIAKYAHKLLNGLAEVNKIDIRVIDRWKIAKMSVEKFNQIKKVMNNDL